MTNPRPSASCPDDSAALSATIRSRTEVSLLSSSAILPRSSAVMQTPLPAAAAAKAAGTQLPGWRWRPPLLPTTRNTASTTSAASTTRRTSCSTTRSTRSSRLSTDLLLLSLRAATASRASTERQAGTTRTQPPLSNSPPDTQRATTVVARAPPPRKPKRAPLVLMHTPRMQARKDTTIKTAALGTNERGSPRRPLSKYAHSMISAARATAIKTKPRKERTMSGRISVRMLGLASPSLAWRSLRQSWMYGHEANHERTIRTTQSVSPNHTGTKTVHQDAPASQPSVADTETMRAPCEKTNASRAATRRCRVRNAVFSWAEGMSASWAPSGSKSMATR
mmetsp:Transcript_25734/g.74455  ORF Transcript_25734/g.74455 Transcript_25734/m.74455 type:complete len:337 (+) Transcript_25734:120-1130(+)